MSDENNWNKKFGLFASGIVCSLAFRIPISTANFCVVRFNLDSSCLSIFTSRIVNGMLIGQLFGNWLGVIFTALGGVMKLWTLVVANWLCLIFLSFTLFCFVESDEGHLTAFYWSMLVVNFFAKVSDAQCLEIAPPESTNWYVSTFSLSPTYLLVIKTLLLKLINWTDDKNTLNRVTAISASSVKTRVDYRLVKWMIVWTIILSALVCVLWTVVFILGSGERGTIKYENIQQLKCVSGIVMGTILTVPGALLGILISSPSIKCFKKICSDAMFPNVMKWCPIIFCTFGALIGFAFAIGLVCNLTSESETWVPSSIMSVPMSDQGKNLGIGLGGGLLLGLCFGAIAVRCNANICKRTVPGLAGGALLGAALGILIYEVLTSTSKLKPTTHTYLLNSVQQNDPVAKSDVPHHLNSSYSQRINEPVSNSQHFNDDTTSDVYGVEDLLKSKVLVKDLPTFDVIKRWADLGDNLKSKVAKNDNNLWAKAFQKLQKADAARTVEWDLAEAIVVNSTSSTNGNYITINLTFSPANELTQNLNSIQPETIKETLHQALNEKVGRGRVTVTSVTGKGTEKGKLDLTVEGRLNGKPLENGEQDNIMKAVQDRIKKTGKVAYLRNVQWDFTKATVNVVMSVNIFVIGREKNNNKIAVTVGGVSGAKRGDILQSASDKEKIIKPVQDLFDSKLGKGLFLVEKVEGTALGAEKIKMVISISDGENVWAKALQKARNVDATSRGQWDFSRAKVSVGSVTLGDRNQLKITANLLGAWKGQTATTDGKKKLEAELQEIIGGAFANGAVTAKVLTATAITNNTVDIVLNAENVWAKALQKVKEVDVAKKRKWRLSNAEVDVINRAVTTDGSKIKISATFVGGAKKGDRLVGEKEKEIKKFLEEALNKVGSGRVRVTSVTGEGTEIAKVEFCVTVERAGGNNAKKPLENVPGDAVAMKSQAAESFKVPTADTKSFKKSKFVDACVSSVIMNVLGLGTIYSVYPAMAPRSIIESSYIHRINFVILIVSAIPPTVILYVSETTSGGPEEKWEGAAKAWYVGLLFMMVQNMCMIFVVFVVHFPDNKLAKAVTMSPVMAGALTVTIVTSQVVSTCIGYPGVVANSKFTMMSFNNTATLTTTVFMSLFGDGYLTELKKYEPGEWPTQGMGKWDTYKWWNGKTFGNAWLGLLCIFTTDLRRNIMLSANDNK